jgi:hypothetical protein
VRGRLDETTLPQVPEKNKIQKLPAGPATQKILLSGGINLFSSALLGW